MAKPHKPPTTIGIKLRGERHRASLTQLELAGLADLSQAVISQIEGGQCQDPGASKVRRLEDALGLVAGSLTSAADARSTE